jgi:alkaline phosphatase D
VTRKAGASIDRREFLRAVVVVAGPVVSGCADGDDTSGPPKPPPAPSFFPQSVASGDPRPTSVILWTRVEDEGAGDSVALTLEVARDESFSELIELSPGETAVTLSADARFDHCVKVRVESLEPGTTYFYRFTYARGEERHVSASGRTKTAPNPDADVTPRFAVVSCQDYAGKYYHVLRHAAEQDPDFVVHLGDYVYETIDDRSFQDPTPGRRVSFRNPEEAHPKGTIGSPSAATSFGNYCDLYRTVRSDPDLQRLHERAPMIAISDDHEFSNDCHGATATYTDGREDELDLERRRNADRAWFSYMPVDYDEPPAAALDEGAEFPDDFRIYRSFVFGRHLELVMTDLRRFKPDHLVPEDAFPGAVFLDATEATALLGDDLEGALPYVNIDAFAGGAYAEALRAIVSEPERISGLLSVRWVNGVLEDAGVGEPPPIDDGDPDLERGFAYEQLLKSQEYSSIGARNLVAEIPFRALAAKRWKETGGDDATSGESELVLGATQRSWFLETLRASTRTFKVWGNEYALMRKRIDLSAVSLAPEELRTRILLNADDWDGAPNERDALLRELSGVENLVVVTGDLHAFFAGTPYPEDDTSARVVEFIAGSASSAPWLTTIERIIESDPTIPPEAALLARNVGSLLLDDEARPNPHMGYCDLESNGYALVTVGPDRLEATLYTVDDSLLAKRPEDLTGALDGYFRPFRFRVLAGSRNLEQEVGGNFRRWDLDQMRWV